MATIANASGLDNVFDAGNSKWFENMGKSDDYDYVAGDGEETDLADQDKNSDQNTGKDAGEQSVRLADQQDILNQDNGLLDTTGSLGLADGSDEAGDAANGVEFVNSDKDSESTAGSGTGTNGTGTGDGTGDSNGSGMNGNGNGNNNGNNGSSDNEPEDPQKTWINDQLKPNDPIMTEYGELIGLSASFKEGKGTYCRGDKFQASDVEVTATYRQNGQTVTRTLKYGGDDGYSVSFSTYNGIRNMTAVFTYKGMTAQASYTVTAKVAKISFEAVTDDGKVYSCTFPGSTLEKLASESENSETLAYLKAYNEYPYNVLSSGQVLELTNAMSRMIAFLGDASIAQQMKSDAIASGDATEQNRVYLQEQDGYLTTMVQGFATVKNNQVISDSYAYYPEAEMETADNVLTNLVAHIVTVPDGYKIRRVTHEEDDLHDYWADQVLTEFDEDNESVVTDGVLQIPMGVTSVKLEKVSTKVKSISFPESVWTVDASNLAEYLPDLESYSYDIDNAKVYGNYQVVDGMLLSKDCKTLISVPPAKENVVIPASVTTLGENCLKGVKAESIRFEGKTVPKITNTTGYQGTIVVEDSAHDLVRKHYMFAFGEECENIRFTTVTDQEDRYQYQKEGPVLLYRSSDETEGKVLAAIPTNTKGNYTVDNGIDKIGSMAFMGCTKLTDVEIGGSVKELKEGSLILPDSVKNVTLLNDKITVSANVFGDPEKGASVPDVKILVKESDYDGYLKELKEKLDPVYGAGTAEKLLAYSDDSVVYEDGVKYRRYTNSGHEYYRLEDVYDDTKRSVKVKDGTKEIDASAFAGCDRLEILYLPKSVDDVAKDTFADCTGLETLVIEDASSNPVKQADTGAAEVLQAGDEFSSFTLQDGILCGKQKSGALTLINVTTDHQGTIDVDGDVTVLYKEALKDCGNVTALQLENEKNLTEIGEGCFENCTGFENIDLTQCTKLQKVGAGALRGCDRLRRASLPEQITTLENEVFYGCTALEKVEAGMLVKIGGRAFAECGILGGMNINFDNLESIGDYAFYNCRQMGNLELPESVSYVGQYAFANCANIKSLTLNGVLTGISRYCFYGCNSLTSVTFGEKQKDSLQVIGVGAFSQCTQLRTIDLSELMNLQQMGESTFAGDTELISAKLPASLQKIPDNCFHGATQLSLLQIPAAQPTALGEQILGSSVPQYLHIRVPEESLDAYRAEYVKVLDVEYGEGTTDRLLEKIDENTETINGITYAYTDQGKIIKKADANFTGELVIDSDVVAVADDAFAGCEGLTSVVTAVDGKVSFGDRCFKGCTGLKTLNIRASVPEWGEETFMDCTALEQAKIGYTKNNVINRIGTRAFKNCTGLKGETALAFLGNIYACGESSFEGCSNITAVGISTLCQNSLATIEDYAFAGCTSLNKFINNSKYVGMKTIGNYAFKDCDSLTNVFVCKNVTSIGEGCFMGCDNVKTISFYAVLDEYPKYCFKDCPKLVKTGGTAAAFKGVKRIGEGAYENCVALNNSDTVKWYLSNYTCLESVGDNAFRNCVSLTGGDSLAATLTSVGAGAFDNCVRMTSLTFKGTTPPTIGAFSMKNRPEGFMIKVPDSQDSDDSVYKAYYEVLKNQVGIDEETLNQILDSVSDGAKARHDAELAKAAEQTEDTETDGKEDVAAGAGDPPENPEELMSDTSAGQTNSMQDSGVQSGEGQNNGTQNSDTQDGGSQNDGIQSAGSQLDDQTPGNEKEIEE